jgi:type II secretory pathway pseudopilin PulG
LKYLDSTRGDTLIEVMFAVVILSAVLISCFALANTAFRQGGRAQERAQAANLAQEQYEALRAYRDGTGWAGFYADTNGAISGPPCNCFHLEKVAGVWKPVADVTQPIQGDESVVAANGTVKTWITKDYIYGPALSPAYVTYGIHVSWQPPGTGPLEYVEMKASLADLTGLKPSP